MNSSPLAKKEPVPDAAWLRAERGAIHTTADLEEFDADLGRLVDDLDKRPGTTVWGAIGWTLAAILIAIVIMGLGFIVEELGASMWRTLSE